jgi:hypothetical protein
MADPHVDVPDTSWVRTAKDLFAGAAGGVAQVLLGIRNPFQMVLGVFELVIALQRTPENFVLHLFYDLFLFFNTAPGMTIRISLDESYFFTPTPSLYRMV